MPIANAAETLKRTEVIVLHVPIEFDATIVADNWIVPAGIVDLLSFRDWALSDECPESGRIDYFQGRIAVDLSMEQLYDHNQVKAAIFTLLFMLTTRSKLGRMFEDGTRVSLPLVDRSTEPDAVFVSFTSFRTNRVRETPGLRRGTVELEGPPDMVLEVVSDSSEEMDFTELPDTYYRAGIREFWRVDARTEHPAFEILKRGDDGFIAAALADGFRQSVVFGNWFQLNHSLDERGRPLFELIAKD